MHFFGQPITVQKRLRNESIRTNDNADAYILLTQKYLDNAGSCKVERSGREENGWKELNRNNNNNDDDDDLEMHLTVICTWRQANFVR